MRAIRVLPLLTAASCAVHAQAQYQRPDAKIPRNEERAIQASRSGAGPRPVTARGPLLAAEIALAKAFREAKASTVYIDSSTTEVWLQNRLTGDVVQVPPGTGTGFIWDEVGHVVTNLHVVTLDVPSQVPGGPRGMVEANEVHVTLANGQTYQARVIGRSLENDIAVLKVFAPLKDMKAIPIGRSADLLVGQMVLAIGNPWGLDHTLTTGVVSALKREIVNDNPNAFMGRRLRGMIQIDAAINPGNSGGPLLDSAGRLIGMNTLIPAATGASVGVGFAIPVDTLNRVVPVLITRGQLQAPEIGITTMNSLEAARFGIKQGLVIQEVQPGSPAAKAGLRPLRIGPHGELVGFGDILLRFKGKPIENEFQLFDQVELEAPSAPLEFDVLRDGSTIKVVIRRDLPAGKKGPET